MQLYNDTMKKWIVNTAFLVKGYGAEIITIGMGTILTDVQYRYLYPEQRKCCVPYKRAPKAPKLYNVELCIWDKDKKTSRVHSTIMWNSPYALCKWKKKVVEQELLKLMDTYGAGSYLTDHPDNGFYYKIVRADKKK